MVGASLGKSEVNQLQGQSHRLNGAAFFSSLRPEYQPAFSTRTQLGNWYYLLSPKWVWGTDRAGESALSQLQQLPALVPSWLSPCWRGCPPALELLGALAGLLSTEVTWPFQTEAY